MRFDEYYMAEESIIDNPSFRSWFAGSKIVDKQGNPLVVYHGTKGDFHTFDYKHLGVQGRSEGVGFYFTDKEHIAKGYAEDGKLLKVYLRIKKPLDTNGKNFNSKTIEKIIKRIAELESKREGIKIPDGFLSNWGDINYDGFDSVVNTAVEAYVDEDTAVDFQGSLIGEGIDPRTVNDAIYDITGHDGIIAHGWSGMKEADLNIYIPFFPNQIKSVDNKTFSPKSDSIHEDGSFPKESQSQTITVYHGSNSPIKKFDRNFSAQGVFWFSNDKDKILRGESGAVSSKYIITADITVNKTAGWKEYDEFFLQELKHKGYDSIKLDDDWVVFDSKNIKVIGLEERK